jgi:hypothetical protein
MHKGLTGMTASKYLLVLTVVAGLGTLGCYPNAVRAEDAAPADAEAQPAPPRSPLRVESVDFKEAAGGAGKVAIAGIALPNNELYLFFDDQPLARVVPDDAGKWSVESDLKMDDRRHTLRAEQYDPVTHMLAARAMVTIQRAEQPSGEAPKTP